MGKRGKKSETSKPAPTRKTKAAVDRRQNNNVKAVSGIAQRPPHYATAVPTAMRNRVTETVRSSAVGKQLKQKKSSFPFLHTERKRAVS